MGARIFLLPILVAVLLAGGQSGVMGKPLSVYPPSWAMPIKGRLDTGTYKSLARVDRDTFDVEAAVDGNHSVIEILAGSWLKDPLDRINRLRVGVTGQFSRNGVQQIIGVYNFATRKWDDLDVRRIGTGDDITIVVKIIDDIDDYISPQMEVRVRVVGRHKESFVAWTNGIRWDVRTR